MSNEFIVKFRPFDKIECCFDIIAVFATMLPVSATISNEISFFRQSRNKLNMFNLFRLSRKKKKFYSTLLPKVKVLTLLSN